MHLAMSALVLAAGLSIALFLDASSEEQLFGYVLAAVGALGLAGALIMRRRRD
ncbi:hypothetical protein [Actinoplanes sp. URMC 104]|uniref:hypothetical protein n=1 Tax=Actinoplanes sp. URMC 104 TaxID=3423409 RepID=UPI003F1B9EFA